jgi:YD repeat-containing protein
VVWSSAPDGRTDLRYDDDGRLVEARNILYTWRYRYDADGRLVGGEPPDPSWTLTRDGERLAAMSDGRFTRTFTWDDQGRLIRVDTAQAAGDLVTTFEWSGGRLTALTDGDGRTVVAYDCAARAT